MDVRRSQVRVLGEDLVGRHPVRDHRHDRGDRKTQPSDARQPAHDSRVGGDAFVGHVFMLAASGVAAQAAPYAAVAAWLIPAKAGNFPHLTSRIGPRASQCPEAAGVLEVTAGSAARSAQVGGQLRGLGGHVPFVRIALSCDGTRQPRPGTSISMICS